MAGTDTHTAIRGRLRRPMVRAVVLSCCAAMLLTCGSATFVLVFGLLAPSRPPAADPSPPIRSTPGYVLPADRCSVFDASPLAPEITTTGPARLTGPPERIRSNRLFTCELQVAVFTGAERLTARIFFGPDAASWYRDEVRKLAAWPRAALLMRSDDTHVDGYAAYRPGTDSDQDYQGRAVIHHRNVVLDVDMSTAVSHGVRPPPSTTCRHLIAMLTTTLERIPATLSAMPPTTTR